MTDFEVLDRLLWSILDKGQKISTGHLIQITHIRSTYSGFIGNIFLLLPQLHLER